MGRHAPCCCLLDSMRRNVVSAISSRGPAGSSYRFRSFDEDSRGETLLMSLLVIVDEHRAAALAIAVAATLLAAFLFGYGAGGVVDKTLAAIIG
jgi:hypothetical protein